MSSIDDFDTLVKQSVKKSFGVAVGSLVHSESIGTDLADNFEMVVVPQGQEVDDESGRRYFMWGVSTWVGDDVVKE